MHWYNDLKTTYKVQGKIDYSDQKQYRQHKDQQNKNNWKTTEKKEKWEEKQLYGHFKRQASEILDMAMKGKA